MNEEDYISKLITGKKLDAPVVSKESAKKLKKQLKAGFGYVKY
jgi:hypothetical protein